MTIPCQSDIEAAWHALPAETRDRIGIIAIDMVFQGFVSGAAHHPDDRAVPGDEDVPFEIRGLASEACDRRLSELHEFVEGVLPDLFGPDGENPAWSQNPGPRPCPRNLPKGMADAAR